MISLSIFNQLYSGNNPLQLEFEQVEEEKNKYKKIKLSSEFSTFEKMIYKNKAAKIYETINNKYNLNDLGAYAMWLDMKKYQDYKWSKFILKILICRIDKIDREGLNKGFVWKITNPETNTVHYLVGTIHAASKGMIKCPNLVQVIDKIQLLLTESGYSQDESAVYDFDSKYFKDPSRFGIDAELKKEVNKKGISIQGLDVPLDVNLQFSIDRSKDLLANYKKAKSLQKNHYLTSIHGDTLSIVRECIPLFKAWHDGVFDIATIVDRDEELYLRNQHWLYQANIKDVSGETYKGLLELIQNSTHSTGIAVGLAHCLGNESNNLLKVFKEKGYLIEKLEVNIPKAEIKSFPKPCFPGFGNI